MSVNESLAMEIRAYDEFQAVLAKFATGLEGVERVQRSVTASADSLNQAIAQLFNSIQKTAPPTETATRATKEKAKADDEATTATKKRKDAKDQLTPAVDKETQATKRATQGTREKAAAERDAAVATKQHKDRVDDLLQGLGALGILATVKRGLEEVTTAGSGFDRELGIMRGLTGEVSDAARTFLMELEGQRRGVTELATGMNELARAGFDAADSMAALPEVAQFAQAGLQDLEKAAAPVLTTLKAFGMEVRRTGEVTDVLTTAANRSALGFDDFQLGLAMSAGAARLAGQDYTELIAVLSVLRDAGLGASDAGTSIKSAWIALMNPSEEAKRVMRDLGIEVYDAQGNMKSWADIVEITERALRPYNEQTRNLALTTVFGSDGIRAMAMSMGRGSENIRAMTEDLKSSRGATAALAHEMGNTFTGSLERTQANLEKLKVTVFEDIRPGLTGLLEAVDTLIVGFNALDPAARGVIEVLVGGAGLVAAIAAVAQLGRTTLIPMLQALPALFSTTAASAGTASTALAALGGPVGIAIGVVAALTVGTIAWVGAQEKARQEEERRQRSLLDLTSRYAELQGVMDTARSDSAEFIRAGEEQEAVIKQIGQEFPHLVAEWNSHGEAIKLNTSLLNENKKAAEENAKAQQQAAYSKAKEAFDSLRETRERLERDLAQVGQMSNAEKGLFMAPGVDSFGFGDAAKQFSKTADEIKREIAEVDAALATARANLQREWAMLHPGDMGTDEGYLDVNGTPRTPPAPSGLSYDPNAAKRAEEAEKARLATIRDQMDLLRHLMAMDDARVDTLGEQLTWLENIRTTLGSTRDLAEAIYELQQRMVREPLQQQLAAFEQRQRLGEVTARQEQAFYEDLVRRADELHLTEQERQEYGLRAVLARKAADKELNQQIIDTYRTDVEMNDLSTAQQVAKLGMVRKMFAEGSEERKRLDLEYYRLSKQLQEEDHDAKLAEIEFDSIVNRWSNDQKLAALREYLDTAANLTHEQRRQLQMDIAQMEQQQERDHQQVLIGLIREGLESQRRLQEAELRKRHKEAQDALRAEIAETTAMYDAAIAAEQRKLERLQAQSREIERQNRLLEIQEAIGKVDEEIDAVRKLQTEVIIGEDGVARRTYDEDRERELLEERANLEKDYADEQDRQERDREMDRIQRRIANLQQDRQETIAALNQQLQDLQTKQAEELEALNLYWNDRLSTQSLQQQVERSNWKTHYAAVLAETEQWVEDMNSAWERLQQPKLQTGADLVQQLGGAGALPGAGAQTAAPAPASAGGSGDQMVHVHQYGTNNYYGAEGMQSAAGAMASGFRGRLQRI